MEENITTENNLTEEPKRPQFLTVLCILSYIWSGFTLLCLLICLVFSSFIFEALEKLTLDENTMAAMDENQQKGIQTLLEVGPGKFAAIIALGIVIYMISLLGVIKMWKLQKWGFYIYSVVNTMGVIYSVISGSYFMAIISLLFVIMYYTNFKHMNSK
jgi:hypothetical protein